MSKNLHPNEVVITPKNHQQLLDLAGDDTKRLEALHEQKRRQELPDA